MDDAELRQLLRAILDLEGADPVDWTRVQQLSADLDQRLAQASEYDPPHLVFHYLDDSDIRQRDSAYAETQRAEIRRFVETGEREQLESRPVPRWLLLIILGLLAAVAFWVVA
ncbi:MAG TPA: hypothetical protein VGD23_08505, partial [Sphingomicrobium sp.]